MAVGRAEITTLAGVRSVPLDGAELECLLDRLDQEDQAIPGRGMQQWERYRYRRLDVMLKLYQPGGTLQTLVVPTRNISAWGLSLVHGGYVYIGTRCTVQLVTARDTRREIPGRVVRCRHTGGRVHEMGIRFEREIDAAEFLANAIAQRVLVAEDDAAMGRLLCHYMEEMSADVEVVENGLDATDRAMNKRFDLILLDLDMPDMDGLSVLETLRRQGCCETIVALTAQTGAKDRERFLEAGFDDFMVKPVSKGSLERLLSLSRREPVYSSLTGGPRVERLVAEFVAELGDKVRAMENALGRQDMEEVRRLARSLHGEAGSYGFQPLAEAADAVDRAAEGVGSPRFARLVRKLVQTCRAARGHTMEEN
ncbi:MAG: response regulator [Phycisphaerales bacterium]|nr:MAG: response regulator [Phycisphaerales bacterium]